MPEVHALLGAHGRSSGRQLAARPGRGMLTEIALADTWFPNGTVTNPNTAYEGSPNGGTWQPVRPADGP